MKTGSTSGKYVSPIPTESGKTSELLNQDWKKPHFWVGVNGNPLCICGLPLISPLHLNTPSQPSKKQDITVSTQRETVRELPPMRDRSNQKLTEVNPAHPSKGWENFIDEMIDQDRRGLSVDIELGELKHIISSLLQTAKEEERREIESTFIYCPSCGVLIQESALHDVNCYYTYRTAREEIATLSQDKENR